MADSTLLKLGFVHTPITPFDAEGNVDFGLYRDILAFHLRSGAEALALPMHVGESVSLSDEERQTLLEFAVREVGGRVPVVAHVSQSGTEMAKSLAVHAEQAGADAIICTTPYYWKPAHAMMLSHLAEIGGSVKLPYFLYNAPAEMGGTRITRELAVEMLGRLENFAGVVDSSLDWQFLLDVVYSAKRVRPDFQLLTGIEYMISAGAIGASGAFAPHASIAPGLVRQLYDLCKSERYADALPLQVEFASLYQSVKGGGVAAVKAATRLMGRECGAPRAPLMALSKDEENRLADALKASTVLATEATGW